jgi:O-Antigen ligase
MSVDVRLGGALAAGLAVVAFLTTGGSTLGPNTWTEIVLVVLGLLAAVAMVTRGRVARDPGLASLVLFAALAMLTAASIAWSVQPDDSWLEANRTLSYFAAFACAFTLARLFPRRWAALVGAVAVAATVLSAWALLVKVFPSSLDSQDTLGRLNAPFAYWNATGLIAALGIPPCLWAGTRRTQGIVLRALTVPAIAILVAVVVLSYSRSAVVAAVVGAGCWLAVVPLRLRGALVLAVGAAGGAVISLWALGHSAFTADQVSKSIKTSTGHSFGVVLVLVLVATVLAGIGAVRVMDRARPTQARRRQAGIALLCLLALVPAGAVVGLAASHRGLTGEVSHLWTSLTSTSGSVGDNPDRLVALANSRPRYWRDGLRVGSHALLGGVGALGYATARPRYTHDPLFVQHAHSYVIETFADFGLIGIALSLALLIAWCRAAGAAVVFGSLWRRPPGTGPPLAEEQTLERAGLLTLLCVVIAFGVHSTIDWTWFIPGVAIPAIVCAGWLAGRGPLRQAPERAARRRELTRSPGLAAACALATVAVVAAAWAIWQPLRAVDADSAATAALLDGDTATAFSQAHEAVSDDPLSLEPLFVLAQFYSATNHPVQARAELVKAVQLQPDNAASWQQLGDYDLRHHAPKRALASLQRAHLLNLASYPITSSLAIAAKAAQTP